MLPPLLGEDFVSLLCAGKTDALQERRVIGAVVFRGGTVHTQVRALYVYFEGEVDFSDTRFEAGVDLSGCTFASTLSLKNAHISGDLRLDDINVRHLPPLLGRTLPDADTCTLSGIHVAGSVTINRSLVAGPLSAKGMTVEGSVEILGSEIDGETTLSSSRINGDLALGCWNRWLPQEEQSSQLWQTGFFNADVNASDLRVRGKVEIVAAQISGSLHLWGGVFESSIFVRPLVALTKDADGFKRRLVACTAISGGVSLAASRVEGHVELTSVTIVGPLRLVSTICAALSLRPLDATTLFGPPCQVGELVIANAHVRGRVDLLMLVALRHERGQTAGVFIHNSMIGGDLRMWRADAYSPDGAEDVALERDELGLGAVIWGDLQLDGTDIKGECDLTNAWVSGSVRLNGTKVGGNLCFRSRRSLMTNALTPPALLARLKNGGDRFLRARASSIDLSMAQCANEIDLSGLVLTADESGVESAARGSIVARSVKAGAIRLYAGDDDFASDTQSAAMVPGFADFSGVQTSHFVVSTFSFDAAEPREVDVPRIGLRLAAGNVGELEMRPFPRQTSGRKVGRRVRHGFPVPLDLRDLNVAVWSIGGRADPDRFRDVLEGDPVFRRDTYTRVEHSLRNGGHEAAATEIYKEMCRRERSQYRRDAWKWPEGLWRLPLLGLGEVAVHFPYSKLMGFGTAPLRLLVVIGLIWALALRGYYQPANFEESLESRQVSGRPAGTMPDSSEWRGLTPFFASVRYHIPVVGLSVHDEWQLAGSGQMCLWPAQAGCARFLPLAPEDFGMVVSLLNWTLWPFVLTFTLRRLLR